MTQLFPGSSQFLVPFAVVATVAFAIVAVVTARREPDPAGTRPYAIYLSLILFVAVFTALFSATALVSNIVRIPLKEYGVAAERRHRTDAPERPGPVPVVREDRVRGEREQCGAEELGDPLAPLDRRGNEGSRGAGRDGSEDGVQRRRPREEQDGHRHERDGVEIHLICPPARAELEPGLPDEVSDPAHVEPQDEERGDQDQRGLDGPRHVLPIEP